MDKSLVTMLAHTLKGPGLSCLFVMMALRRAVGVNELADLTDYGRRTVAKGLKALESLNLAQQHRRFNGWLLTDQGYQLALDLNQDKPGLPSGQNGTGGEGQKIPLDEQKLPIEGQKIPLAPCSSSGYINESINKESLKLQLLQENEGQKLPLEGQKIPIEGQKLPLDEEPITPPANLVRLLTRKACYPHLAEKAITTALARGEIEAYITAQIESWFAWCSSPFGKSIKHPGIFTAKKIENGEVAPDLSDIEVPNESEEIQWIK